MQVRRFLDRLAGGRPDERAEIVTALVRVYLEAPLGPDDRATAVTAMTVILDDPAPRVRRAMAEMLADSPEAPRPVILGLAEDQADIAEIVLARSPVLTDSDLVDIVGGAGDRQRRAVARRPVVTIGVSAAIVELAGPAASLALVTNPGAMMTASTFRRLIARHRTDAAVRSALLERGDLPLTLRHELIEGLSEALGELVRLREWLPPERAERVFREARERSVIDLSQASETTCLRPLVERLAGEGRLTASLVIRAACAGNVAFLIEALAVLSAMPNRRVETLIRDREGAGFPALYRRTGLAAAAEPAFRAVLEAMRETGFGAAPGHAIVERALARYRSFGRGDVDEFLALLSRLSAEGRRNAARAETGGYFRAA